MEQKRTGEQTGKNRIWLILACIVPVVILWCGYAGQKISPFGDNLVYTWDLSGQYSAFFVWLHRVLTGQADGSYTLSGGFGTSMAGLIAYYLGSPLNLVLVFFNEKTMPYGVAFLSSLKVALMGGIMYLYLQHKAKSSIAILFSTAYALSSYVIAYGSNLMWLDAIIWLPLVAWGIEQIIEDRKSLLYVIALGVTIISNYYIGFMVCLFSVIYFVLYLAIQTKKHSWKTVVHFMIGSVLAGCLSAVVLLPVVITLQGAANRSQTSFATLLNWSKLYKYRQMLQLFLAGSFITAQRKEVSYSGPLLYCGMIFLIGIILLLVARRATIREKLFYILLLGAMAVSFIYMNFFSLWHGLYSPQGAPWRNAFIWSFVALSAAYLGVYRTSGKSSEEKKVDLRAYLVTVMLLVCYVIVVYWKFYHYHAATIWSAFYMGLELIGIFIVVYLLKEHVKARVVCLLITLAILGSEEVYNMQEIWSQGYTFDVESTYQQYVDDMQELISSGNEDESSAVRSVTMGEAQRSRDDGFLLNLNTIDMYSSTETANNWGILYTLGLGQDIAYCGYNDGSTQLVDALVGIRDIYTDVDTLVHERYQKVAQKNQLIKYENEEVLPLAYLVKSSADTIQMADREAASADLFEIQNELYHAISGSVQEDLYQEVEPEQAAELLQDQQVEQGKISWLGESYYTDGTSVYRENETLLTQAVTACAESTISVSVDKPSHMQAVIQNDTGENAYACFTVPYEKAFRVTVNGEQVTPASGMGGFLLVPVGTGTQNIEVTYHTPGRIAGMGISLAGVLGIIILSWIERKKSQISK